MSMPVHEVAMIALPAVALVTAIGAMVWAVRRTRRKLRKEQEWTVCLPPAIEGYDRGTEEEMKEFSDSLRPPGQ